MWRWTHVKVSQSVTAGSQGYLNHKKISNNLHSAATYEQTKKGLSYFYPKESYRRRWNRHKTFTLVKLIIVLIICPILYILINFFKLSHNLFT